MENSISKKAVFNMINKGLSVVFPLVTISYVSRILGASGIGEVSSAQNLAAYFSLVAALGIPSYGVRAIAQTRENRSECSKTFSELFTINLISTGAATLLYIVLLFLLKDKYTNIGVSIVFVSMIIFNIINIEWVYQGFEKYEYITIRSFIVKIISILLLFFVRQKTDLVAYAAIICFGSVGNYILNFLNLKKYVDLRLTRASFNRHMLPILTFFASVVAIEMYSLLDVTMLTIMTNKACVGYYSNSTKIVKTVANTLTGISAVLMPRFSYLFSVRNYSRIKELSEQFLNLTFAISIPGCIGINLLANQIVEVLFGENFEPAVLTIRILSLLIILMPLSGGVFCQLLLTSGKEKFYLACVLSGTIVNAVLNYFLIPINAQSGAAIASVIAELTVTLSMIIVSRKTIRIGIKIRDIISVLLSSFLMGIVLLLLRNILPSAFTVVYLIIEIVVAVFIYFCGIILLKSSFSQSVKKIFKYVKDKFEE